MHKKFNISILKIWKHLSSNHKNRLVITLLIMIMSGLTELLVINSVMPFLAGVANPESLGKYKIATFITNLFNIPLDKNNLIIFILFFTICVFFSAALKLLSIWLSVNLSALVGNSLSSKSFSGNIYQPYEFHIKNNSNMLITSQTKFVNKTVSSFSSFLNLIYNLILTIIISIGIFLISPNLTLYSLIIFSFIYFLIGKKFKKFIANNNEKRMLADQYLIKSLQESIGSIRNVLLESNQELHIKNFKNHDLKSRKIDAHNSFIAESPRYAIEALALVFIAFSFLLFLGDFGSSNSKLATIGGFTLGMQKLLPAFQRVYGSWIQIRTYKRDTEDTLKNMEMKVPNRGAKIITPIKFQNSIKFDSVFFSYNKNKYILSDVSFEIFKGQRIGIIGVTGSGKTTLTDLMMGLLKPTMGKIFVDDKDIHDINYPIRINKWMNTISHVPQNVFLTDSSIAENIAFGINKNHISIKKVIQAAKKAQIHDYIESTRDGYLTKVGERGIKLSGGQIQRIAIARALYKKSNILLFDEATSSLDQNTETELMKSINNLSNELTVISISHRHSTLKNYDRIIQVEKGHIIEVNKENLII